MPDDLPRDGRPDRLAPTPSADPAHVSLAPGPLAAPQPTGGMDVSHRGGRPGFVKLDGDTLVVPDFRGNRYFNTLGNLVSDPRAALVFVDFAALFGGLGFLLLGHLPWPWLKHWWPTRHVRACSVVANEVIFSRKSGPKIAVLSLTIHVLAVVIAWGAVRSVQAPAGFEQLFMLTPPIMLITMLPISIAGWACARRPWDWRSAMQGCSRTRASTSRCCSARSPSSSARSADWSGSSARRKPRRARRRSRFPTTPSRTQAIWVSSGKSLS